MVETLKVLVTVKTYPHPSQGYQELVCTAGVLEDGSFVRLYPIDYRYRPYWEWFSKYDWVEVKAERNRRDPRPESYSPVLDSQIRTIGHVTTHGNWAERTRYALAKGARAMCELDALPQNKCSLGIVRAGNVKDFLAEPVERDWPPKWRNLFEQRKLFGPKQKPLEKVPFKFSYVFECDAPGCKGHRKMIEDWEVFQLFRRMREEHRSEEVAVDKVKETFLGRVCATDRDTHFFVGTVLSHGAWIILGTFWPKKR
jgi:hypothetical protein